MPSASSPYTLSAALRRQWVLCCALLVLATAVGVAVTGRVPLAGGIIGGLLLVLAGMRAVLPTQAVGAIAVRSRVIDVGVMLLLGVGLIALLGAPNL
ncbi:MAG: DUF3017 domain-containing protein [Brachybacterium sp.]|nr:DUF3017 domain-containing protein [Brachybacterium sp.]